MTRPKQNLNRGGLIGNFGYVDCIFRLSPLLMVVSYFPQDIVSAILQGDAGNRYQLLCGHKLASTNHITLSGLSAGVSL
jgi:hypothetical protein